MSKEHRQVYHKYTQLPYLGNNLKSQQMISWLAEYMIQSSNKKRQRTLNHVTMYT